MNPHTTVKALVVTFSGALNPSGAVNRAAYHLYAVSKGPKPVTTTVHFASATYNATAHSVTLVPLGTVPNPPLHLDLNPKLLLDAEGRPLTGDVTLILSQKGVVLPPAAAVRPAAGVSAMALDALMLNDWRLRDEGGNA